MSDRIIIGENQTAVFTLPNGIKLSITREMGGVFIHAGSDDIPLRASISLVLNAANEGWVEARTLPPIKDEPLREQT